MALWKDCPGSKQDDERRVSPGGEGVNLGYACAHRTRDRKEMASLQGVYRKISNPQ